MLDYVVVFFRAVIGRVLRHGMSVFIARLAGTAFPWHALVINILGSLVMRLVAGYFVVRDGALQSLQSFLATGILGGFTTFSLDAVLLWRRSHELWTAF